MEALTRRLEVERERQGYKMSERLRSRSTSMNKKSSRKKDLKERKNSKSAPRLNADLNNSGVIS